MKLEEFKDGYSVDLLLSSPETLEKHYECLSNLSENSFGFTDREDCLPTSIVLGDELGNRPCKAIMAQ